MSAGTRVSTGTAGESAGRPTSGVHPINHTRPVRITVLFFVIFHAAAGVRVMLLDFGLAERWHHGLVWTLAGIGLIIFGYVALRYA